MSPEDLERVESPYFSRDEMRLLRIASRLMREQYPELAKTHDQQISMAKGLLRAYSPSLEMDKLIETAMLLVR
jgi:hypothetical protein